MNYHLVQQTNYENLTNCVKTVIENIEELIMIIKYTTEENLQTTHQKWFAKDILLYKNEKNKTFQM